MRRPPSPRPAGILRPAYVSLVADSRYRPKKKFRSTQGTQLLPRRRDSSRPRLADLVSIAQRELRTTLAQRQSPKVRECGYRGLILRKAKGGPVETQRAWVKFRDATVAFITTRMAAPPCIWPATIAC